MANPNRNQKIISEEERNAMSEGAKVARLKKAQDTEALNKAQRALFEKSKENLPIVLKERIADLEIALERDLPEYAGLRASRIHQLISRTTSGLVGYTGKELAIVFDYYKEMVDMINKHTLFIPSIKNFCAFAGFSSSTYKSYQQSPDDEKREVMAMIDDYISDMLLDASKMRKTDASTSIFVAKAEHQMTEAVNPQQYQSQNNINIEEVMARIAQIRSGVVIEADFKEKEKK